MGCKPHIPHSYIFHILRRQSNITEFLWYCAQRSWASDVVLPACQLGFNFPVFAGVTDDVAAVKWMAHKHKVVVIPGSGKLYNYPLPPKFHFCGKVDGLLFILTYQMVNKIVS